MELHQQGDSHGAVLEYQKAVEFFEQTAEHGTSDLGTYLHMMGLLLYEEHHLKEAIELLDSALDIFKQYDSHPLDEAFCRYSMGNVLLAQENFEEALQEYHMALALFESTAPGSLAEARTHNMIGYTLMGLGHVDAALFERRRASDIEQTPKGPDVIHAEIFARNTIARIFGVNEPLVTITQTEGCPS